jgi:DNA-binding NarL/FixJ family response regulator
MTPTSATRVVIADDHPVVRSGLRALLATMSDVMVVGEAENGQAAVDLVAQLHPDIVIMDVQMPVLDGVQATRLIATEWPAVGVLVLTMFEDDASLFAAIQAGARGYILKGAPPAEVARAIGAVREGQVVFGAALASQIARYFALPRPARSEDFSELTHREREVLGLLASGATNIAIARRLSISAKTVANHVSNLLTKLQSPDRAQAIIRARDAGLGTPED